MLRIITLAVLAVVVAIPLNAQANNSLQIGSRIRLQTIAAPGNWVTGPVRAITPTSIWIDQSEYSLESIHRLEVSDGQKSRFLRGLMFGALAGTVIGAATGGIAWASCDSCNDDPILGFLAVTGIGFGSGVVIGGIVGANTRGDRWRRIPNDRLQVGVTPTAGGGLAMRVGVSF
jgi:hypothetical protein